MKIIASGRCSGLEIVVLYRYCSVKYPPMCGIGEYQKGFWRRTSGHWTRTPSGAPVRTVVWTLRGQVFDGQCFLRVCFRLIQTVAYPRVFSNVFRRNYE